MSFDKKAFALKLEQAVNKLKDNLGTINTRISANILNPVKVDAYGDLKPLNQVASVNVSGTNALSVQPWDKSLVSSIIKAIQTSGLNLNPISDAGGVRVPIPPVTEERRKELANLTKQYLEQAKIAMRNIRNAERDSLKAMQTAKQISEDDFKRQEKELQKIFDEHTQNTEKLAEAKAKDILS
jgi:ribosome recycling factor